MSKERTPEGRASFQSAEYAGADELGFLSNYVARLWSYAHTNRSPACFPRHITIADGLFVTIAPEEMIVEPAWRRADIQLGYDVDNNWTISYRQARRSAMRHDDKTMLREIDTYTLAPGCAVKRTVQKGLMWPHATPDAFVSLDEYDCGPMTCEDAEKVKAALEFVEGAPVRSPGVMTRVARLIGGILGRAADNKNGTVHP